MRELAGKNMELRRDVDRLVAENLALQERMRVLESMLQIAIFYCKGLALRNLEKNPVNRMVLIL